MSLISLVYVSIASQDMNESALKALLKKSRENNQQTGVTGMLLYRDGFFIQALEGEEETIITLFEKIQQDKRHYNVLLIYQEPITRRDYPDWTMGFAVPDLTTLKQVDGFSDFMQKPPLGKYGELAMQLGSEVKLLLHKFRK